MHTELNIAARVRRVVIPMPTLPGTDFAGMKRDSQARICRIVMMVRMMTLETCSPQTLWRVSMSAQCGNQSDGTGEDEILKKIRNRRFCEINTFIMRPGYYTS